MMKLPKQVYIYEEDDGQGGLFLVVAKTADEIPADRTGDVIGVYALQSTKKLTVTRALK
jgi:hypothetical protein